jgi:hypothetical protein
MKFSFYSFVFVFILSTPFFVFSAGLNYVPLQAVTIPGNKDLYGPDILEFLVNLYTFTIALAGALAVIKIVYAGIKYMLSDAFTDKGKAKDEIWASVIGLVVILGSYTLLSTINPALVKFNLNIGATSQVSGDGRELIAFTKQMISEGVLSDSGGLLPVGSMATGDGSTHITAYGYSGDLTPDTNSTQKRGNHNNLLTEGSVALSPDVIAALKPEFGAAVYVGGTLVGYYDDSTAASYNGKALTNRVDRFDPTGSLGGNNYSQSGGAITIDNNNRRPSISNP